MVYKWKEGAPFRADPEKVAREVSRLGNFPTARDVLDEARNPKSELHQCFEWDDTLAGIKYRIIQAQKVLSFLVRVENDKDGIKEIQAFSIESFEDSPKEVHVIAKVGVNPKPSKIDVLVRQAETIASRVDELGFFEEAELIRQAIRSLKQADISQEKAKE
jgi:hypothetical protein